MGEISASRQTLSYFRESLLSDLSKVGAKQSVYRLTSILEAIDYLDPATIFQAVDPEAIGREIIARRQQQLRPLYLSTEFSVSFAHHRNPWRSQLGIVGVSADITSITISRFLHALATGLREHCHHDSCCHWDRGHRLAPHREHTHCQTRPRD